MMKKKKYNPKKVENLNNILRGKINTSISYCKCKMFDDVYVRYHYHISQHLKT